MANGKYGKRKIWKTLTSIISRRKKQEKPADSYLVRIDLTNEMTFRKIDRLVRENRLYMQPDLKIGDIADMLGTNRTYVSRALQCHAGGFVNYMRRLKVDNLHAYITQADEEGRMLEDGEDLAMKTGFVNKRAMQRAVKIIDGVSFYEFRKGLRESQK